MSHFLKTITIFIFTSLYYTVIAQCVNEVTLLDENFNSAPIVGAITSNIYGNGTHYSASLAYDGTVFGWFNVIDGVSDVDFFDREVNCVIQDSIVNVSFWTRETFGNTNVTYSIIDDLNNVLATTSLVLTSTYEQISFSFPGTTPSFRVVFHINDTGGSGKDIIIENLLITQCQPEDQNVIYPQCTLNSSVDLYSFFSQPISTNGVWSGPSVLANGYLGTYDPSVNSQGVYTYTIGGGCNISTVEIFYSTPIDLGNDTTICQGNSVLLDAGSGQDSYLWSTGATTQTINVTQPGTYMVTGALAIGNKVVNGDFEGGSTATSNNFTTDYVVGTGGPWGMLSNPETYGISTNPNSLHNNFLGCSDHTSGTGNMLVANGSSNPNSIVWSQDVTVQPNTDYLFSFWTTRVSFDNQLSNLQLNINGVAVGPVNTTGAVCNWLQISSVWNSGTATTATLSITNLSTSASGNDFAIDDITFSPICTVTDEIEVFVSDINVTASSVGPSCNGVADAEIHIDAPGANEYSFDNGITWQVDSFAVNFAAGTFDVCARNPLGCMECTQIIIDDPAPVVLYLSEDDTVCQNGTADLQALATGGPPFSFHWGHTTDLDDFQQVSPITSTYYTVFAENNFGCTSPMDSILVTVLPPISGTISPFDTICPTYSTDIMATASGGIGEPYTYIWSTGDSYTGVSNHQINVTPSVTTTYTVTITDGCESSPLTLTTDVVVAPLPVPTYLVTNPLQCEPAEFEIINTTTPSMSEFVYWEVDGMPYLNQDTIISQTLMAGNYDIFMMVTSYEGCVDSILFPNALHVDPIPEALFHFSPDPVTMFNTDVTFNNYSYNGDTYQWFFPGGSPATSTQEDVEVRYPDGVVDSYDVMLITTSALGCVDTLVKTIVVNPEVILYAPNTFTPDGDEFNQTWNIHIEGVDIYNFELFVFNRWGEVVWESHDPSVGWDGTYKGKLVEEGTYTWIIRVNDQLNDDKHVFNGFINLIK